MKEYTKKEMKLIVDELFGRFLDGARLTVADVAMEYFKPKGRWEYVAAQYKVRTIFSTLKVKFRRGIESSGVITTYTFGNIDDFGNYGIALDKHDYAYVLDNLRSQAKGIVESAIAIKNEARQKGMLPKVYPLQLLSFGTSKE